MEETVVVALAAAVALSLVAVAGARFLRRYTADLQSANAAMVELRRVVESLPVDAAIDEASRILAVDRRLQDLPAGHPAALATLGPITRSFFERYPHVSDGCTQFGGDSLGPSSLSADLITIGGTVSGHRELCVRPGDDMVVVVDTEDYDEANPETYPSVYHYIVFWHRAVQAP